MGKNRLPNKPSALLQVALADLEKVMADPRYQIDMSAWHEPNGKCRVCFAGSVMAKSLNVKIGKSVDPGYGDFDPDTSKKLRALNCFRCGELLEGLEEMGLLAPESFRYRDWNGTRNIFDTDELDFLSDEVDGEWLLSMQDLVGILEAEGL